MRPNITIIIPEPYLPLDEYCRRTGTSTAAVLAPTKKPPGT